MCVSKGGQLTEARSRVAGDVEKIKPNTAKPCLSSAYLGLHTLSLCVVQAAKGFIFATPRGKKDSVGVSSNDRNFISILTLIFMLQLMIYPGFITGDQFIE